MDTDYVMRLVRAYGRAVRTGQNRYQIQKARAAALEALGQAGVLSDMDSFLAKYGEHSARCGDRSIELEERGAAGGRAIEVITRIEQAVRSALRETAPPRSRPTSAAAQQKRPWTMQIQVYDPIGGWVDEGAPTTVAVAGTPEQVGAKIIKRHDLDDQHRVRLWRGADTDTTRRRPALVWPHATRR